VIWFTEHIFFQSISRVEHDWPAHRGDRMGERELRDPASLQQGAMAAVNSIAAHRTNLFGRVREYSPIADNVGQQCNSIIGSGATTPQDYPE
jgi:hypothetical protein